MVYRNIKLQSQLFFFQAEHGIRDVAVTGVQTCALPISLLFFVFAMTAAVMAKTKNSRVTATAAAMLTHPRRSAGPAPAKSRMLPATSAATAPAVKKIGRASRRETVSAAGAAVPRNKQVQ